MPKRLTFLIDADGAKVDAVLDKMRARVDKLDAQLKTPKSINVDDKAAQATLLKTRIAADRLRDRLDMDLTIRGAAKAEATLLTLEASAERVNGKLSGPGLKGAITDLGTFAQKTRDLSVSAMPALIGAGVALSPVIATLGAGLGGLGVAAIGVAKNQALMRQTLAPLKAAYGDFEKTLQPVILKDFAAGIGLAEHGMHDLQPVAQTTGKALALFLGQLDKTMASGEFQQFFQFMAKSAGPDMAMLGRVLLDVIKDLPPLLEQLQPVAVAFLEVTDAGLKVVGVVEKLHLSLPILGAIVGAFVGGPMGALVGASIGGAFALATLGGKASATTKVMARTGAGFTQVTPAVARFGTSAAGAVIPLSQTGKAAKTATAAIGPMAQAQAAAALKAEKLAAHNWDVAHSITAIMNAETKALNVQLAYSNSQIQSANDAQSLRKALKASGGQVGLQTAAQRASLGAANQYISDLETTAKNALAAGRGIGGQRAAISAALPLLEKAAGHNKYLWGQIKILKGWLDKLREERRISQLIKVTGTGNWSRMAPGAAAPGQPGMKRVPAARGTLVTGGTPGKDSVLIHAMPGELVVPTKMVNAGAVDHLRGRIPGFSGGGIIPSYSGAPGGLKPWGQHNLAATQQQIINAIGNSLAAIARNSLSSGLGSVAPASGSAGIAQRYAASLLSMYGWSQAQMRSLIPLWNQESGWNDNAVNPSSGAYGIPQALGHGHPFNLGDYKNQIIWGLNYIRQRYITPAAAWAHERAFNWYGKGTSGARPGLAVVGERGPELVNFKGGETVFPAKVTAGLMGYAKGTKDWAKLGRELLRRHHSGVLNHEITNTGNRMRQEHLLASAPGLSRSQHRHYAAMARADKARLASLKRTHRAEEAYRGRLEDRTAVLKATIKAAKAHGLHGEAVRLGKREARDERIVRNIDLWLQGKRKVKVAAKAKPKAPAAPSGNMDIADWAAYLSATSGGTLPAFARGSAYVPATGPAIVHRGEMILPGDVADLVRSGAGSGGGNFTGNLYLSTGELLGVIDGRIERSDRSHNRRVKAGSGRH